MNYALKNKDGKVVRTFVWPEAGTKSLSLIVDSTTRRLEFKSGVDHEDAVIIRTVTPSDVGAKGLDLGHYGRLYRIDGGVDFLRDTEATEESEDRLPFFFKWSAIGYVSLAVFLGATSFIINRFFSDRSDSVVVQVIPQDLLKQMKAPTVAVRENPVKRVRENVRVSDREVKARFSQGLKNPKMIRASTANRANNVENMGALGALSALGGGFSPDSKGSGGLAKGAKNNPGIGYGGVAARGGHERGLVGNGLVASGVGNNGNLVGYGGYGTKGEGGGSPGYGHMKMGGKAGGGFFQPLSEESLVEGGLDREQINAVIQRNRGQITYCYERGLQKDPSIAGRVEVNFVINPLGQVSAARIGHTSLSARQVENCIVDRLRGWKFPNPIGKVNVRVSYPFLLQRLSKG
jgi:hypothetical protein